MVKHVFKNAGYQTTDFKIFEKLTHGHSGEAEDMKPQVLKHFITILGLTSINVILI